MLGPISQAILSFGNVTQQTCRTIVRIVQLFQHSFQIRLGKLPLSVQFLDGFLGVRYLQ